MNVRLLRRVQKYIAAEPRRFNMWDWYLKFRGNTKQFSDLRGAILQVPPCKTVACIAGTAVVLTERQIPLRFPVFADTDRSYGSGLIKNIALEKLNLTFYQGERLFYLENWPSKFERRYNQAKTPRGRANAAIARIDHFIKTNGAE